MTLNTIFSVHPTWQINQHLQTITTIKCWPCGSLRIKNPIACSATHNGPGSTTILGNIVKNVFISVIWYFLVTFAMTFPMVKFTKIVMDDRNLNEVHAICGYKVRYVLHSKNSIVEYCHGWLKFGWEITWWVIVIQTFYSPLASWASPFFLGIVFNHIVRLAYLKS